MSKDAITIRTVFAVDPGPEQSAYVLYDRDGERIIDSGIVPNSDLLNSVESASYARYPHKITFAIEWIESFGMSVGASVFETCYWIGRFDQVADNAFRRVTRRQVKLFLCNSMRAKDPNVRQALIDRFPATGGGKVPQVGTKAKQGPLYGVKSHIWSALAVAVTVAAEQEQ